MKSPIVENLLCPSCQDHVLDRHGSADDSNAKWQCSNCGFEMTNTEYENYNVERFKIVDDLIAQTKTKTVPGRKFGVIKK